MSSRRIRPSFSLYSFAALRFCVIIGCLGVCLLQTAEAQHAPGIGYMFPSGGQPGETVEVLLGGYDWTPDMQLFAYDRRAKLEMLALPGPVIVPEPPYWFGKKARRSPFLLPRETKAKLTLPSDLKPGVYRWQVANANGAASTGRFSVVSHAHLVEPDQRGKLVELPRLPITVSGQIKHIEEVDRYRFKVEKSGPVTISTLARELKSPLNAVIEVRDNAGRMIADGADTSGDDTSFTFAGEVGNYYTLSLYDLDFRGNRSFVYQVSIETGPRIVATIPAIAQRGETRSVEFVGYGLTGQGMSLQSVKRDVVFPSATGTSFDYEFKTRAGETARTTFAISEVAQRCEADGDEPMSLPLSVTGVLDERYGEDSYKLTGTKGETWSIELQARRIGSPLDVAVAVFDATGKELKRSDDVTGTTDAAVDFRVPADGEYRIAVSDSSGRSGNRAAVYRLQVKNPEAGFRFTTPEFIAAPIGKPATFNLKVTRTGGLTSPIKIMVKGLPEGVDVPAELLVPEKKNALGITFAIPESAPAAASLVTIHGESVPAEGEENPQIVRFTSDPVLFATTITPPFAVDAEGKDDVSKWPRGTTFPYPVLIERNEGFNGEIVLEMTSRQGRHRQGIHGPELKVPTGVKRILYPIFLPEWLETTRTSRLSLNGVAKIPDGKGKIRYSLVRQKTRMGFLPGGALLKLACGETEIEAKAGDVLQVPLTLNRAKGLTEPASVELLLGETSEGITAKPMTIDGQTGKFVFPVSLPTVGVQPEYKVTVRATVQKNGDLPTVSQTSVIFLVSESFPLPAGVQD
jgi:hypothetical protein